MVDGLLLKFFDGRVRKCAIDRNKVLLVFVEFDRNSEISDFEDFVFDKNIVGLEVVMNDLFAPEQAVPVKQVLDDCEELSQVKLSACPFARLNKVSESRVIAVLHHKVIIVIRNYLERIDLDYVFALLVIFIPTN